MIQNHWNELKKLLKMILTKVAAKYLSVQNPCRLLLDKYLK